MTFTTVPDKTAGDVFTEAMWDTYLRDNFNAGVMRCIADSGILGVDTATITFSSIPATFAHLRLIIVGRGNTGSVPPVALRFNGDAGTNYQIELTSAIAAAVAAAEGLAQSTMQIGVIPGPSDVANAAGVVDALIAGYAGTTFHKTVEALNAYKTATGAGGQAVRTQSGTWASAAAINAIAVSLGSGSFLTGSRLMLYGVPA